ncbi:hypothetical protein ZWY2020_002943 [Hordeum vulgare]|nr:hypothetical protein ZWY2020_002943 [Hordeum vulgare]
MASQREEEAEQQYQWDSIPARRSEQVCAHGHPVDSSFADECGCLPAHGSNVFGGLDLSSQASFMELMHSTPSDVYEEGLPSSWLEVPEAVAVVQGRGTGLTVVCAPELTVLDARVVAVGAQQ